MQGYIEMDGRLWAVLPENQFTHEDITQSLYAIRPGAQWSLIGNTQLRWDDGSQAMPTAQELFDGIELGHMNVIRERRNELLSASDWTQYPDAPLTVQQKADWATYRQVLRDLPQTYQTAAEVVWPTKPE